MAEPTDGPADPMTVLQTGAVQRHELYQAHLDAGFTPAQSMQILCTVLATILRNENGPGGE